MLKKQILYVLSLSLLLYGCEDSEPELPSVEERKSEAIEDLRDELTSPPSGWKVNYQPTSESGTFFMILNFDEDGTVSIQSDVAANEGEFFEQTIPYRIDAKLGLELIFETFGVFHYLFELDQARFGAEFEFLYQKEEQGNLYFESKSDVNDKTIVVFEPASNSDVNVLSREIVGNFSQFSGQSPRLFGGQSPTLKIYLEDKNITLFWWIDLVRRTIFADVAGEGQTFEEIMSNGSLVEIGAFSGYKFSGEKLVLDNPVSVTVNGEKITVSEINLSDFSVTGAPLCDTSQENTPVYKGSIAGLGQVTISKSLFNSGGSGFTPQEQNLYSVNIPFIFDDSLRSLAEEGSIAEKLPNAVAFIMTYGFVSDTIPANAIGFLLENEDETTDFYLRSFEATSTIGNKIEINLLDEFYHTGTPEAGQEQSLREITDEIFEGGAVYAYFLDVQGLTVFQFYNPCNGYEFVLVQ